MIEQPTPVVLIREVPARINDIQNIEIAEKKNRNGKIRQSPILSQVLHNSSLLSLFYEPPIYTFFLPNNLCAAHTTNAKSALS